MAGVSRQLREVLARAESWPVALQEEAVRTLLTLEAQGTGIFHISDEVWEDMKEGLAQAERREFVSDEDLAKADKRLGSMRVRYTPAAFAEREAIFEYLNERSPQAAREVVGLIVRRVAELAEHPRKGHPTDRKGIYALWIAPRPYHVFYRIDGEDVVIVHIRHTARKPWRGKDR